MSDCQPAGEQVRDDHEPARGRTSYEAPGEVAKDPMAELAHDLRNLLTPLKTRLELLRRRAERDQLPLYVRDAELALAAVERVEQMITQRRERAKAENEP